MKIVTVLGGYGVFGSRICSSLAAHPDISLIIAGRNRAAGERFANSIGATFRYVDTRQPDSLDDLINGSYLVIHAAGPFQEADYSVARSCIRCGTHYIDLADARDFVAGITSLDNEARERAVFITSGCSSVPAITSALVRELAPQFRQMQNIQIALSPGNQNPRGASTISAILSYLGRQIRVFQDGRWITRRGWGDARVLDFPFPVGQRHVYNCDVPDLELFPAIWRVESVRFSAGLELNCFNWILAAISRVRVILPMPWLSKLATIMLKISLLFFRLGTKNGSLAVWVNGVGHDGQLVERRLAIVTDDDGPATPSTPAIVLARRLVEVGPPAVGAYPCIGFISLEDLKPVLHSFGVWCVSGENGSWSSERS
ncbi:MAG: saccharopine dehydrogenase family protein [Candidatus Sumerlaeaceae bacterium]